MPRPPRRTGKLTWDQAVSFSRMLQTETTLLRKNASKSSSFCGNCQTEEYWRVERSFGSARQLSKRMIAWWDDKGVTRERSRFNWGVFRPLRLSLCHPTEAHAREKATKNLPPECQRTRSKSRPRSLLARPYFHQKGKARTWRNLALTPVQHPLSLQFSSRPLPLLGPRPKYHRPSTKRSEEIQDGV